MGRRMELTKNFGSIVSLLCLVLFSVSSCLPIHAVEQCPSGVERIHADCVWDNDHNMTVEQNDWNRAGYPVSVAVIDKGFWFDEYPNNGTIKHHDDLSET